MLFPLSTAEIDIAANAFLIPSLLVMSAQILLLCVFGQKLIISSVKVAEGIYNCNWTDSVKELRVKMVLIIMQAQKPRKLTAMKFVDVSLESFKNVRFRVSLVTLCS